MLIILYLNLFLPTQAEYIANNIHFLVAETDDIDSPQDGGLASVNNSQHPPRPQADPFRVLSNGGCSAVTLAAKRGPAFSHVAVKLFKTCKWSKKELKQLIREEIDDSAVSFIILTITIIIMNNLLRVWNSKYFGH